MTSEFRVIPCELTRRVEELYILAEQLNREIVLLQDIEERLNIMWEGESRLLFHRSFMRDIYRIQNHRQLIVDYADRLNTVSMRYTTAELAAADIVKIHLV